MRSSVQSPEFLIASVPKSASHPQVHLPGLCQAIGDGVIGASQKIGECIINSEQEEQEYLAATGGVMKLVVGGGL